MSRIAHADGTVEGSPSGGRGQAAPGGRKARRNVVANIALSDADGVAPGGSAPEAAPPAPAAAGAAAAAGGGSGGGGAPELQAADAKAYEEEMMRLSREFQDRWLVVKAYKEEPASTDAGSSTLMKILEGTESEQREALQSIVPRPQPLARRTAAPPPRIAPAAPEPEPEPEPAAEAAPSAPAPATSAAALLTAAADAARDLLSPVVSLSAASPPASADEEEPLERSHSAEQQDMAKQYWQYNLNEDRNATLGATFCCHCVLAGAPAASECSALVFLTEGDSAEVVIVRESAVVGSDEPEGVPDQIGRHPLFELCKVVRGDSDQYLRLEFEGGSAYVLLTRDEAISTEILEQLDEAVGMGATAAIDGAQHTRLALCETLRTHHTEADDDEGKDMSEDDILAYFLLFQLDNNAGSESPDAAAADPHDVTVGLADRFCASSMHEGRPRTLVISMDWLYLCREDYAIYPLGPGEAAPPERPNFNLGDGPQHKQILADLTNVHLLGGPNGSGLELIFEDEDVQCERALLNN